MTYGSCHSRCESNVHTWLKPCASASFASCTVREAGGLVCRTTPKSMGLLTTEVLDRPRLRKLPVALGAEVLAAVDDDLAARQHRVDVAVDLEALPGGVVHVHVVRLARRPMEVCPFGS